jgi:hypothetical protein
MPKSRREFLAYSSIGLLGTAIQAQVQTPPCAEYKSAARRAAGVDLLAETDELDADPVQVV